MSSVRERLGSEDAERLVPRLVTGSIVASVVALVAAGLIVFAGGGVQGGPGSVGTPAPSQAPKSAAAGAPSPASSAAAATASPVLSGVPGDGTPPVPGGSPAQAGIVGNDGIAAWDALAEAERNKVTVFQSFFLHQSVGQDLEDGAEALGFKFGFAASSTSPGSGLNGGTFASRNGDPAGKIAEFGSMALANQATVRVAIMKFGYADIVDGTVADVQRAYQAAVGDIKARGIRVLHVTPPLVYDAPADNAPKMQVRTWMMETFKDDVIFDLQDVESTDPAGRERCERGGSWEICNSVRSTADCRSAGQGIDAPSGQGHICQTHAQRLARAFLYAIYLAGR